MSGEPLVIEQLVGTSGQTVLRLKGPLTTENISLFQNAVRREDASTVILDLTNVPYMDSSGLGSLVGTYTSCHKAGRRMVLSGVNERVGRLLEITKTDSLFLMFPSLWEAMEALTGAARA